ncbi:MAG: GIY-YIG nuclease family protein [Bacteroidota bacterium]
MVSQSPATIKIYLVNGDPQGLRTAELSNWTGKAIAAPRTALDELQNRCELQKTGIYFLTGLDDETGDPAIYIGEAEQVGKRLKHHRDKDFWNAVTVFVSKDRNLTKSHIRYLEGELISSAEEVGRAQVMNNANSGARLPEPDEADMKVYLDNVLQLLPILGLNHFTPVIDQTSEDEVELICTIKGLEAKGKRVANGFVVFEGSQAVYENRPSIHPSIAKHRDELIKKGILGDVGNHYRFTKDFEFGSPSRAASIVRGGNSNGLKVWKTEDGISLKNID